MQSESPAHASLVAAATALSKLEGKCPPTAAKGELLALCQESIKKLFEGMNIKVPSYPQDPELIARVNAEVDKWANGALIQRQVLTALTLTMTAYSHIKSLETRIQISLFTSIILALDDPAILDALPSRQFHESFAAGWGTIGNKDTGLLGELALILPRMWSSYPRFAASAISTSALDFVNMTILENETKDLVLCPDAAPFLLYRRTKSATAEAYAYFIWDKSEFPDVKEYVQVIPDTMLYVNYVNDILSFYKEELAGETGNFIGDAAVTSGKSVQDVLNDLVQGTVAAAERVRRSLGEGKARAAWENFARGYIAVHVCSSRYRLQEVIGSEYLVD